MALKITPSSLKRLEGFFEEAGYTVRYERGHFQSGSCLLEERRVVVINRFLDLEGRINALAEMLPTVPVDETALSPEMLTLRKNILADAPSQASQQADLPLEG